jgi:hypothetical protein
MDLNKLSDELITLIPISTSVLGAEQRFLITNQNTLQFHLQ